MTLKKLGNVKMSSKSSANLQSSTLFYYFEVHSDPFFVIFFYILIGFDFYTTTFFLNFQKCKNATFILAIATTTFRDSAPFRDDVRS